MSRPTPTFATRVAEVSRETGDNLLFLAGRIAERDVIFPNSLDPFHIAHLRETNRALTQLLATIDEARRIARDAA